MTGLVDSCLVVVGSVDPGRDQGEHFSTAMESQRGAPETPPLASADTKKAACHDRQGDALSPSAD